MLTKNTTPNLTAAAICILSLFLPEPWRGICLNVGLFALSGALTNWLAVHMLFDKVPGLYGSGVITLHFEEFKTGILNMVHKELLAKDNVERLFSSKQSANNENAKPAGSAKASVDIGPMLKAIDLDEAFDQLVATIVESSFGSMLSMVGGESALQPLREPFKTRMEKFLSSAADSPKVQTLINQQISKAASSEQFIAKLDHLLRARLDEMTPEMVKDIMQRMIKRHLGWLVVWGGVFGGIIGLVTGIVTNI